MSYILEALKKAQAERQLGNAPTIHAAQPVTALQPGAAASRKPLYVGLAAGALVVMAGAAVLWRAGAGHVAASAPASASVAQVGQAPQGQVVATGTSGTAGAPAAAAAAPAVTGSLEVSAPPAPLRAPQPRVADAVPAPAVTTSRAAARTAPAAPVAAPAVQLRMPTPPPAAVAGATPARAAPASAGSPAAEDSLPFLQQLPESVQGGIPRVAFGGYMYSANPADRLLLVDKALRHEGEEVAPGLVLEKLLPRAAVMNYRGVRYRVAY
jgi:general secretion pathway protein B